MVVEGTDFVRQGSFGRGVGPRRTFVSRWRGVTWVRVESDVSSVRRKVQGPRAGGRVP